MKKNQHFSKILAFVFACCLLPNFGFGQDQAIHFNGTNEYASFSAPSGLPAGNSARTIEFWLRSDLRSGAKDNHESIVELGQQGQNGSAFGLFTQNSGGSTWLCFWGHNADKLNLAKIPDDQWHHVAITYQEPRITCFLDGEFQTSAEIVTAVGGQRLKTQIGTCYLGAFPARGWYFQGAIDNLSIWNKVRSCDEIKNDMSSFPKIVGTESGLIAHFRFDEGRGASFRDAKGGVTGTLVSATQWTKAIAANPDVVSEGIWFVIQNKSDVDNDFGIPAKAIALKADGDRLAMQPIPATGDFDAFLWKTIPLGKGHYKLVNKKLGMTKALDCGMANPSIAAIGNYSGQDWMLSPADLNRFGENAYTLTNSFITTAKAVALSAGKLTVVAKNASQTNQVWLFQPISLVAGYHISSSTASTKYPYTKVLSLDKGQTIYATNATSDWAVLNVHNIYNNIMYAFKNRATMPLTDAKKTIYIFGRYDFAPCKYPDMWTDCKTVNDWRGYSGNETVITEEMMCRKGTFMRGLKDDAYREFEQVVHEYGHTLNYQFFKSFNIDKNPMSYSGEWFPWQMQTWFNSAQSTGASKNRASLNQPTRDFLATIFDEGNTWLPPRLFRTVAPIRPTFLVSGTLLLPNQPIFSDCGGDYKLVLQSDGNLCVQKSSDNGFRWGSFNNLGAPMAGVKSVLYLNGELLFTTLTNTSSLPGLIDRLGKGSATPEVLGRKRLHADGTGSYRLQPNQNPTKGDFLQVIDLGNNWATVWNSGS